MKMEKKNSVLIVEDSTNYINYLSDIVGDYYHIKVAVEGKTGINIVKSSNQPDLVLLDINLSDMSGYDVCRTIKSEEETKDIPVIFITSDNADEQIIKGFRAGCSDYLVKPFNSEELLARVSVHINQVNYISELKKNDI
jgi:DNA-binding response OmpR family regulator